MNEGGTGLKYHTRETKAKISEHNKTNPRMNFLNYKTIYGPPNLGRKHSDQTKEKMAISHLKRYANGAIAGMYGKHHTEETKNKLSLLNKNRKIGSRTEEQKAKLSAAKKGRPSWTKRWKLEHPDGRIEIVDNMKAYCREHGFSNGNPSAVAKGRLPHYKGIKFNIIEKG